MSSPARAGLEHAETMLRAGERDGGLAALAWLAASELELERPTVNSALRRAMLLLAAGGDPRRALTLDGRAATSLAGELNALLPPDGLRPVLTRLEAETGALPLVSAALAELVADRDLASRALACALLAEELEG